MSLWAIGKIVILNLSAVSTSCCYKRRNLNRNICTYYRYKREIMIKLIKKLKHLYLTLERWKRDYDNVDNAGYWVMMSTTSIRKDRLWWWDDYLSCYYATSISDSIFLNCVSVPKWKTSWSQPELQEHVKKPLLAEHFFFIWYWNLRRTVKKHPL